MQIKEILSKYNSIAVVGLSENPMRPSYKVAEYLIKKEYTLYPVNPNYKKIFGVPCYPDLKSIPKKIDIVNIFRKPEFVLPVVDEAIEVGAKIIWMQLGVINNQAASKAERHGLKVIMNRCIKIEHSKI